MLLLVQGAFVQDAAIAMLKEEANKLGGNALILLRAGRVLSDPHFPSNEFYAHAVVVEI